MRIKIVVFFTLLCTSHVTNVVCEYIVMKMADGKQVPLDDDDDDYYSGIYETLIKYQWPTNLLFVNKISDSERMNLLLKKAPGTEFWEQKYINDNLQKLYSDENYRLIYIPNTIYQLLVINCFLRDKSNIMSNCNEFLYTFFSNFCCNLDKFNTFHVHFTNKVNFENQCLKALTNETVIQAHQEVNRAFGEYLQPLLTKLDDKKAGSYYPIAADIITQTVNAYNDEKIMGAFSEYFRTELSKDGLSNKIRAALKDECEGNTLKQDSIIRKCIDAEMDARANNQAILLRGAEPFYQITSLPTNMDEAKKKAEINKSASSEILDSMLEYTNALDLFNDCQNKTLTPRAICYGIAPFIGGLLYKWDMPYAYAIATNSYFYATYINKEEYYKNNCDNLFLIPPFSAFVQVFGHSSLYHAITRVAMENVPNEEVNINGFELTYDGSGLLLFTKDPVAHARDFASYLQNNFRLLKKRIYVYRTLEQKEEKLRQNLKEAVFFYTKVIERTKFINSLTDLQIRTKENPCRAILNKLKENSSLIYMLSQKVFDLYFKFLNNKKCLSK